MSSSSSRLEVIRTNDRGPTNKRSLRLCIQTCVLVLTSFGVTSPSLARSGFDGAWSVVVVTRAGACTPTLRYPVAITNGIITNGGEGGAKLLRLSGRVNRWQIQFRDLSSVYRQELGSL
jgi:hypothetical protein